MQSQHIGKAYLKNKTKPKPKIATKFSLMKTMEPKRNTIAFLPVSY
jgi:hypothetical protein